MQTANNQRIAILIDTTVEIVDPQTFLNRGCNHEKADQANSSPALQRYKPKLINFIKMLKKKVIFLQDSIASRVQLISLFRIDVALTFISDSLNGDKRPIVLVGESEHSDQIGYGLAHIGC